MDTRQKRAVAILRALQNAGRPMGASRLARDLEAMGIDMSQRTVRYYLAMLDERGHTRSLGKKGRQITPQGEQELANAFVAEKVGFVAAKVDGLAYQMSFRLRSARGTIILNVSTVPVDRAVEASREIAATYEAGWAMGRYLSVGQPGGTLGRFRVPEDRVAIGTVCSLTINGVLLASGIPTESLFGGLLEIADGEAKRFTEVIRYDGTSLDPLEIFISGRMTSVGEVVRTGHGIIGASFREIPAVAVARARKVSAKLEQIGLGGVLIVGKPNRPLLEVPLPQGRAGLIVVGGLAPLAAAHEAGIPTENHAMTGLFEFTDLVPYQRLRSLVSPGGPQPGGGGGGLL